MAPPEDYQEQGEEILVEALPCYQSGEPTSQAAVLVLSDIFGWRSGRTRQICDKIASQGFLVILPNFFHDDGWDHNKPLIGWSCPWYFFKHLMWYGWYKHDPEKSRYSCSCLRSPAMWGRPFVISSPIAEPTAPGHWQSLAFVGEAG